MAYFRQKLNCLTSKRHACLLIGQKPDKGALPTLYAATAQDVKGGNYYGPNGLLGLRGYPKKVKSSNLSHDESLAKQLWDISEKLTGVKFAFS